jgi:hypothetical protein
MAFSESTFSAAGKKRTDIAKYAITIPKRKGGCQFKNKILERLFIRTHILKLDRFFIPTIRENQA